MNAMIELRRSSGAMRCIECGKCSTLCPLSAFGDFSVARMAAIHDPDTQLATHAHVIDRCITCGSCELRCPQNVRFTSLVRGLREQMPAQLRTACPHGDVINAAARLGTKSRDAQWIGDLRVAERGEVALFVGCLPLFDAMFDDVRTIEIARAAVRLLNARGIEPVIAADERCCGHDLLWNGERDAFRTAAIANARAFEARGVKHIVSVCAECTRTWRIDYAEAVPSYRPKVEHISEFLARVSPPEPHGVAPRVTFQDPCRLARHLGVVDAPREVMAAAGVELIEMEQHGLDAQCCGTAGFIHCDADSRRMQEQRLASAVETGADVLLTACPKCLVHFTCAQSEDRRRGRAGPSIVVQDLTVFLAKGAES